MEEKGKNELEVENNENTYSNKGNEQASIGNKINDSTRINTYSDTLECEEEKDELVKNEETSETGEEPIFNKQLHEDLVAEYIPRGGVNKALRKIGIKLYGRKSEEYLYNLSRYVPPSELTAGELSSLWFNRVLNKRVKKSVVAGLMVWGMLFGGVGYSTFYMKDNPYNVTLVSPNTANSYFLDEGSSVNNNMKMLSVGGMEVDSPIDLAGVLTMSIGYWDYLEFDKVYDDTATTSKTLSAGDSVYGMEINAYLAYNNYIGREVRYNNETRVYGVTQQEGAKLSSETLLPNDKIIAIDGQPIVNFYDTVPFYYMGEGKKHDFTIMRGTSLMRVKTTISNVGINDVTTLQDKKEYKVFLKKAKLNDKRVDGDSAGLALAISHYAENQEDILQGLNIGITGAIDSLGNVHPIGGIKHKVAQALKDKLDFIIVPADTAYSLNTTDALEELKSTGSLRKLAIISVGNLDEAITYIKGVQKGTVKVEESLMNQGISNQTLKKAQGEGKE